MKDYTDVLRIYQADITNHLANLKLGRKVNEEEMKEDILYSIQVLLSIMAEVCREI